MSNRSFARSNGATARATVTPAAANWGVGAQAILHDPLHEALSLHWPGVLEAERVGDLGAQVLIRGRVIQSTMLQGKAALLSIHWASPASPQALANWTTARWSFRPLSERLSQLIVVNGARRRRLRWARPSAIQPMS